MKENKRGVSPVIASILLVAISIAAVAIIAGIIVPFVKNTLEKSTECISYKQYYTFDESFGYNCVDKSKKLYAISVKASFDEKLIKNVGGMKIVFSDKTENSKVIEIKNNSVSSKNAGGVWILGRNSDNLRVPDRGGIISYVYNASSDSEFASIEVYPVLVNGRICADMKESINIKPCESNLS